MEVGQLKFGASNFPLNWPTTDQLDSISSDTDEEQLDLSVVYVSDVTEEHVETVLLHMENTRCGGGATEHTSLLDDGTLMAKFADVEGSLKANSNSDDDDDEALNPRRTTSELADPNWSPAPGIVYPK